MCRSGWTSSCNRGPRDERHGRSRRTDGDHGRACLRQHRPWLLSWHFLGHLGRLTIFLGATVTRLFHRRLRRRELVSQLSFVGAGSVGVVTLSAIFTGLVLALQGYYALVRFGSENLVGSLVALSLTRELGPVLTALMVTARAGSAMTATIGNMAVTEQIDALDSLAVDPLSYLALPRLLATVVALPLLAALFSVVGHRGRLPPRRQRAGAGRAGLHVERPLVGGVEGRLGRTLQGDGVRRRHRLDRDLPGTCRPGEARCGVGRATSRTVVETAVLILCGDYVMTALLF